MNEGELKILKVLKDFEEFIEDHSQYLEELENMIAIAEPDYNRAVRIVRRIRRVRKNILEGTSIILQNISEVKDPNIKEESIGIVSYLQLIGLKDEKDLLRSLNELVKKSGYDLDIQSDIEQLDGAIASLSKLSF
ncbi:hypothetical protein [Acidianus brierleyi]|uniref:Uncharacterized protein n=1 Tax=Acidianus brierleyi TaxID=41673 RepID=A0A2U9IEZ1_9CREN|nr:hypothetical protein [Acidianus brierleyi]AWR94560.1 hypothetical protein DFR85_08075 [Acidianus brierleyi]